MSKTSKAPAKGRYFRLARKFPSGVTIPLDAVKRLPDRIDFANNVPLDETMAG